jgi:hypothetical protein
MLAPVAMVEALDFSVVVVAVEVLELPVLLPDPQPIASDVKTASATVATILYTCVRFILEYLINSKLCHVWVMEQALRR